MYQIVDIEKQTARAVNIAAGMMFKIIQHQGPQLAVLVAFNANEPDEYFSSGNTRISLAFGPYPRPNAAGTVPFQIKKGDTLVSNRWKRMLTLVADTYGNHDIVLDPCDSYLNVEILGQKAGYPGCRELHAAAIKEHGLKEREIPAGINLFQNSRYDENGITILPTNAEKDDMVAFKAHMDLIVSVTACPCPLGELRGVRMEIGQD